jgi:hypothetical protein
LPFPYYRRLSARDRRVYDASDAVGAIEIPGAAALPPLAAALERALVAEDRRSVERAAGRLAEEVCARLAVPPVAVRVLAARPSGDYGELHGLYEPELDPPRVTVWMRTAARRRVVAFRSFLRTLVHELLHHLDYELLGLAETFHTEGFFRRESSIARQLLGEPPRGPAAASAAPTAVDAARGGGGD